MYMFDFARQNFVFTGLLGKDTLEKVQGVAACSIIKSSATERLPIPNYQIIPSPNNFHHQQILPTNFFTIVDLTTELFPPKFDLILKVAGNM